ncbi:MAG: hypothetical protein WB783_05995 [Arenicellales bacterium]
MIAGEGPAIVEPVTLRPADEVMRLARMGSAFPTRLSFMRILIRRMHRERWAVSVRERRLDEHGFGHAVYEAAGPERVYSLVAFSNDLDPSRRTDRVIADAWDTTFTLFDGRPTPADIERLRANTPKQEAGRFGPGDLVLCRANKSVRLFEHVRDSLARGVQPDDGMLGRIGYLMRTTAVYGNGKFGIADRGRIFERPELAAPFQAELLTVYLIRCFTLDHVEHVARARGGAGAVPLDRDLKRRLGIGNSTGLGMAPFLVTHPALIHNWIHARELALGRVLAAGTPGRAAADRFRTLLDRAIHHVHEWNVEDEIQMKRIRGLRRDLAALAERLHEGPPRTWRDVYDWVAGHCGLECQELTVSLLIETSPALVDSLESELSSDFVERLDASWTVGEVRRLLENRYRWAIDIDFNDPRSRALFWYTSEDKLEPRLGRRFCEPGAEREMPLAVARDVSALYEITAAAPASEPLASFALRFPNTRHILMRIQCIADHPYGEIRDNLIDEGCRPIDLLRCKLACFGAWKFDPRSDRWTRITLYQGAPLADELHTAGADDWCFALVG